MCVLSRIQLFAIPQTVARQVPLSTGFSGQEYWSGLPFPPLGDLPHPGINPTFPASPALAGGFFTTEPPDKPLIQNLGFGGSHPMGGSFWVNLVFLLVHYHPPSCTRSSQVLLAPLLPTLNISSATPCNIIPLLLSGSSPFSFILIQGFDWPYYLHICPLQSFSRLLLKMHTV